MRIKKKHKTCVNTFFKYKLLYVSLMAVTKQNLQYIHKRERNLSIPINSHQTTREATENC